MVRAPRIAVIGAGLSGLTTAWRLLQAGLHPMVFETQSEPGGRMRSVVTNGVVRDLGAWTYTAGGRVDRLARELGLTSDQVVIPTTMARPKGGRLRVGHLHYPLSLLGTVFSPGESLHAVRTLYQAATLPGRRPDETAGAWSARFYPPEFTRTVLAPLAGLYFLQPLEDLSRDALLGTLRYLARIKLMSFKNGMGHLASHLAAKVSLRCNLAIEALQVEARGVRVRGHGFARYFDGAILATPLPEAARLAQPWLDPDFLRVVPRWHRVRAVLVQMLLQRQFRRPALQVLPPRGKGKWACGFTVERAKDAQRVSRGREAIVMYARPERNATLWRWRDEEIATTMAKELTDWLALPQHHIIECRVRRWPYAVASSDPEAAERAAVLKAQFRLLARQMPIWAAGDYLGRSSLEGAIASAEDAARACRLHFRSKGW